MKRYLQLFLDAFWTGMGWLAGAATVVLILGVVLIMLGSAR